MISRINRRWHDSLDLTEVHRDYKFCDGHDSDVETGRYLLHPIRLESMATESYQTSTGVSALNDWYPIRKRSYDGDQLARGVWPNCPQSVT